MIYMNNANFVLVKNKNKMIMETELKKRIYYNQKQDKIKKIRSDNKDRRNEEFRKKKFQI